MRRVLLPWAVFLAPVVAVAQSPAPCSAPSYREFDFWLGDWDVFDASGRRAGTNRIEKALDGCALHESWTSAGASRGHSYSAWDTGDNKWHQTWVDDSGTVLRISGGLVNGEMVMEGERRLADGTSVLERITWTPDSNGTVRQLWQSSQNGGMRWAVVFDGLYRRAKRQLGPSDSSSVTRHSSLHYQRAFSYRGTPIGGLDQQRTVVLDPHDPPLHRFPRHLSGGQVPARVFLNLRV